MKFKEQNFYLAHFSLARGSAERMPPQFLVVAADASAAFVVAYAGVPPIFGIAFDYRRRAAVIIFVASSGELTVWIN